MFNLLLDISNTSDSSISKENVYQHYLLLPLNMFLVMSSLTLPRCNVNLTLSVLSLWMRRTSYSLSLFICPNNMSLGPPAK